MCSFLFVLSDWNIYIYIYIYIYTDRVCVLVHVCQRIYVFLFVFGIYISILISISMFTHRKLFTRRCRFVFDILLMITMEWCQKACGTKLYEQQKHFEKIMRWKLTRISKKEMPKFEMETFIEKGNCVERRIQLNEKRKKMKSKIWKKFNKEVKNYRKKNMLIDLASLATM